MSNRRHKYGSRAYSSSFFGRVPWISLLSLVVLILCGMYYARSSVHYIPSQRKKENFPWSSTQLQPIPPGIVDPLAGVVIVKQRTRIVRYNRNAFGQAWTDDNTVQWGHNGCDTRDDILRRDLRNITTAHRFVCPQAVITGTLFDPYTGATIMYHRGPLTSEAVQIDHLVPLAYAWDMGAKDWGERQRVNLANDPRELLAVSGPANRDKGDKAPGAWQPTNINFRCQYNKEFAEVIRGYHLSIDVASANAIRYYAKLCAR